MEGHASSTQEIGTMEFGMELAEVITTFVSEIMSLVLEFINAVFGGVIDTLG